MKPETIITTIIGNETPDIVSQCMEKNSRLCAKNDIEFVVNQPKRDTLYSCAGLQADFHKIDYILTGSGILVIDWDVELLEIPDLEYSPRLYCGRWSNNKTDAFIVFSNHSSQAQLKPILKHDYYRKKIVGFLYKFLNSIETNILPERYYKHYHTDLGNPNIRGTYGELSDGRKSQINSRSFQ